MGAVGVFVYPLAFYSGMDLAGVAIGNVVALAATVLIPVYLLWLLTRPAPAPRTSP